MLQNLQNTQFVKQIFPLNCVYFLLKKEDTTLAFIIDTTHRQDLLEYRKAGKYKMNFELPSPLLKPGYYSVDIKYTKPRIIDFQTKENCLNFEVMLFSENEYDAGYAKNRAGIIAIDPILSIEKIQ